MRRALLVTLLTVVLLAIAGVALAPAALLSSRIERATGGALTLRGAEGTVWQGRGVLEGAGGQMPLAWTLAAAPLLHGEVRAQIASFDGRSGGPHADLSATRESVAMRNLDAALPAALIAQIIRSNVLRNLGLTANGELAVSGSRLDWKPGAINGDVRIVWHAAELMLPPLPPLDLGEVTAALVASGTRLAGPVTNQGGALAIQGDVGVGIDGSAAVALTLTPRRPDDTLLKHLLSTLGTPVGDGFRVAWQSPRR